MTKLSIRVDFDSGSLGPGKIRLLELVADAGSIRKASAGMKMSYRKGWLLLKALEETFGSPLVDTSTGGKEGGGARLTPLGRLVVSRYRSLERLAGRAAKTEVIVLAKKAQQAPTRAGVKRTMSRKSLK